MSADKPPTPWRVATGPPVSKGHLAFRITWIVVSLIIGFGLSLFRIGGPMVLPLFMTASIILMVVVEVMKFKANHSA